MLARYTQCFFTQCDKRQPTDLLQDAAGRLVIVIKKIIATQLFTQKMRLVNPNINTHVKQTEPYQEAHSKSGCVN